MKVKFRIRQSSLNDLITAVVGWRLARRSDADIRRGIRTFLVLASEK